MAKSWVPIQAVSISEAPLYKLLVLLARSAFTIETQMLMPVEESGSPDIVISYGSTTMTGGGIAKTMNGDTLSKAPNSVVVNDSNILVDAARASVLQWMKSFHRIRDLRQCRCGGSRRLSDVDREYRGKDYGW